MGSKTKPVLVVKKADFKNKKKKKKKETQISIGS